MTETITPDKESYAHIKANVCITKEYHVGNWRYRCWNCGYEVGIDRAFPKTCPGCGTGGSGGWWGHLTTTGGNGKVAQQKGDGTDIKNSKVVVGDGILTQKRIMLPIKDRVEQAMDGKLGDSSTPSRGNNHRGRGQPAKITNELLKPYVDHGLGCKLIARDLEAKGLRVHHTTVARHLKRYHRQN